MAFEPSFETFDYVSVSDSAFMANWTEVPASLGGGVEGISICTLPTGNNLLWGFVANTPWTGWSQVYDARNVQAGDAVIEFDLLNMTYSGGSMYREFMAGFDFRASETACYRFEYYYAAPEGMTARLRLITGSRNYPEADKVLNSTAWRSPSFPENHHVRIECLGASISVYVDSAATPLLTASDTTLTSGYVGTYLQSGDGGGQTINASRSIDNISVVQSSLGGVPSSPQSLSVAPADSLLTVFWQAPYSDGGSSVTEYRVFRGLSSGAESYLATVDSSSTSYPDYAVTNGISYYYCVKAVNAYGESLPSAEVSGVPYGEPGDISFLRIASGTGSFATISSSNKNLQVLPGGYLNGTIYLSAYNAWAPSAVMTMISTPSWGDHESSYSTIANIGVGYGSYTVSSASFAVPSLPGTYHIMFAFRAELYGSQVASATNWAYGNPVWNDGNDIASYSSSQVASAQTTGRAMVSWLTETGLVGLNVPSDVVTVEIVSSEDPDRSSTLAIASGTGAFSPAASSDKLISVIAGERIDGTIELMMENAWPSDETVPLVVSPSWGDHELSTLAILQDIDSGSSSTTTSVEFDAPSLPGTYAIIFAFRAEPIPDYVSSATSSEVGDPVWNDGNDIADLTPSQISTAQMSGRVLVDWLTPTGVEPVTLPADAIIVDVISPLAPSEVRDLGLEVFPSKSNPYLSLHWAPPEDDGGYPITEYRVYGGSSVTQLILQESLSATKCSTNYSGFSLGATYFYTVTAVNPLGEGPKVPSIYARIPGVPSQVTSVVGMFLDDMILLTWMPPGDDGGSPITQYVVIRTTLISDLTVVSYLNESATEYADTNVSANEVYRYYVVAQNDFGNGTYSSMVLIVAEIPAEEARPDMIKMIELIGGIAGFLALLIPVVAIILKRRRRRSVGGSEYMPPVSAEIKTVPAQSQAGHKGWICPECGAEIREGWYCNYCGCKAR